MDDTSKITAAPSFEIDYIEVGPKGVEYIDYSLSPLLTKQWARPGSDEPDHELEDWHCLNVALICCPSLKATLQRASNHLNLIDPLSPVAKELRETLMQVRV